MNLSEKELITCSMNIAARALLVNADVIAKNDECRQLLKTLTFPIILMQRGRENELPTSDSDNCHIDHTGLLDTIFALNLSTEPELLSGPNTIELQGDFRAEVFQRVLSIATELGVEGREGRPVGTVFVVGDSERVLQQSRQLVLNPFQGYDEFLRNVLDSHLEETIKEFSTIDGAFVIRGDGVLLSAGTQLMSKSQFASLSSGLGTRHTAAAAITASTNAVAIAISQSTGTVSVFKSGQMIMDIHRPSNGARFES